MNAKKSYIPRSGCRGNRSDIYNRCNAKSRHSGSDSPEEDRMTRLSAILDLPRDLRPLNILPFGYPETRATPKERIPGKCHTADSEYP